MWELDLLQPHTLDTPALAFDLTKLIDGSSCDDDFAPSAIGRSKGYSPDSFDMEVGAACFGGLGANDENGWASMTLWIAMKNGDAYALCPLLPTRWVPPSTLIPSLSTSVVSKLALLGDRTLDKDKAKAIRQQYQWVKGIDKDEPTIGTPDSDFGPSKEIRQRPSSPSAIPRLQGPFDFDLTAEEFAELEITDIHVIPARLTVDDDDDDDEFESNTAESVTIVCFATSKGKVLICLNLDTVEGQWLSKTQKHSFTIPETGASEMVVLDNIDCPSSTGFDSGNQWPTFTADPHSRYAFFLTTSSTVQYYSLADWIPRLDSEMTNYELSEEEEENGGLAFRLKGLCESDITLHEEVLRVDDGSNSNESRLCCAVAFEGYSLGYFLLTANSLQPYSVLFDDPATAFDEDPVLFALPQPSENEPPVQPTPTRSPYVPSSYFYEPPASALLQKLTSHIPARHKSILKSEIRMSPATLDIMANAHHALSGQTAALERSAAELYRRVERLRSEIGDAVEQMVNLADRVQQLQENVEGDHKGTIDERIANIGSKQEELNSRFEALKSKAARVGHMRNKSQELNPKEVAWVEEISEIGKSIGLEGDGDGDDGEHVEEDYSSIKTRYDKVSPSSYSRLQSPAKFPELTYLTTLHR